MILTPAAAAAAGLGRGTPTRRSVRLVVARSPSLEEGGAFPLNSAPVTLGRGGQNDLVLDGRRVRLVPPCADRGARRRRLGAGPRVDERHVRQRLARRGRATARCGRHAPRRRDRPARRGELDARRRIRGGERHRAQAAPQRGQLRRRAAALRASQTAWAARRPARSRRSSPPRRSKPATPTALDGTSGSTR